MTTHHTTAPPTPTLLNKDATKEASKSNDESHPLLIPSGGADKAREEEGDKVATSSHHLPSVAHDAMDILSLGLPIFVSRISFLGMKITDTALLGHVSGEALAASALSDLWTMWSLVLMDGRILAVLVGGAVGAGNPKLSGIYFQISLLILGIISIFVIFFWNITEWVLTWYLQTQDDAAFEEEENPSHLIQMAGYYARVMSVSVPAICVYTQLAQFFSAQRILHPEVNAATIALAANLVLGLYFVLGWPSSSFDGFGFAACPIVTTIVTYVRLGVVLVVYVWIQRLHGPCWDGWKPAEITWGRIKTFCHLYVPSASSIVSDFWRVTLIGAIAARLGETEVAIFNTAYRIMWIGTILVSALSGASAINMSIRLGRLDPNGAKQAGYVGIALSTIVLVVLSSGVAFKSHWFARIFTNDATFLEMFEEASLPFACTLFLMNMAVAIQRVPYSMGRTKEIFWTGFAAGWGVQLPAAILCTRLWRSDLMGLYTGMAVGNGVQALLYTRIVLLSDWQKYAELAQERSEASTKQ